MPMWRCPHCGTPQAEAARCWVCRKSSTSCATCRHFRHSVAAQLGYCGLDPRRQPLRGDELRACWEGAVVLADAGIAQSPKMGLLDDAPPLTPPPSSGPSALPILRQNERTWVDAEG